MYAVVLLIAARVLPVHTIVIWQSPGTRALAASRSDFEIGLLVTGGALLLVYLVVAAFLTLMPVRHVLVPHAAYWKTPERRGEMRHRYAQYLGRVIGSTYGFLAAEIVVAMVTQKNPSLQVWWLPSIISLVFVVILLVFAVWIFADGFRPPPAPPARRVPSGVRS